MWRFIHNRLLRKTCVSALLSFIHEFAGGFGKQVFCLPSFVPAAVRLSHHGFHDCWALTMRTAVRGARVVGVPPVMLMASMH